jgi:hypothetical protein
VKKSGEPPAQLVHGVRLRARQLKYPCPIPVIAKSRNSVKPSFFDWTGSAKAAQWVEEMRQGEEQHGKAVFTLSRCRVISTTKQPTDEPAPQRPPEAFAKRGTVSSEF